MTYTVEPLELLYIEHGQEFLLGQIKSNLSLMFNDPRQKFGTKAENNIISILNVASKYKFFDDAVERLNQEKKYFAHKNLYLNNLGLNHEDFIL